MIKIYGILICSRIIGMPMLMASWRSLNPWRSGELMLARTKSILTFPFESIVIAADANSTTLTNIYPQIPNKLNLIIKREK